MTKCVQVVGVNELPHSAIYLCAKVRFKLIDLVEEVVHQAPSRYCVQAGQTALQTKLSVLDSSSIIIASLSLPNNAVSLAFLVPKDAFSGYARAEAFQLTRNAV